jgi:hypothetical protein
LQIRDWMIANNSDVSFDWPQPVPDTYFYRDIYLDYTAPSSTFRQELNFETIQRLSFAHLTKNIRTHSARENMVVWLFRLRSIPVFRFLFGLVPFELQRKIKRQLSHRPLHDILNEKISS